MDRDDTYGIAQWRFNGILKVGNGGWGCTKRRDLMGAHSGSRSGDLRRRGRGIGKNLIYQTQRKSISRIRVNQNEVITLIVKKHHYIKDKLQFVMLHKTKSF